MPIDDAMREELAEAWLTPYLEAASLSPSHPLRAAALRAADRAVYESYDETARNGGLVPPFDDPEVMGHIAADVVAILRGVASVYADTMQPDRSTS
jgi:hypothetical protein